MHVVFTLHLVAFYQKIRKKIRFLVEKVSLNFPFFYGWCCWYYSLPGFYTVSFCRLYRPFTETFRLHCQSLGNSFQEKPVSTCTRTRCHQNSEGCAIFTNTVNRAYWNNYGALACRRASGWWATSGGSACAAPLTRSAPKGQWPTADVALCS
jgi:hypothetical protein